MKPHSFKTIFNLQHSLKLSSHFSPTPPTPLPLHPLLSYPAHSSPTPPTSILSRPLFSHSTHLQDQARSHSYLSFHLGYKNQPQQGCKESSLDKTYGKRLLHHRSNPLGLACIWWICFQH